MFDLEKAVEDFKTKGAKYFISTYEKDFERLLNQAPKGKLRSYLKSNFGVYALSKLRNILSLNKKDFLYNPIFRLVLDEFYLLDKYSQKDLDKEKIILDRTLSKYLTDMGYTYSMEILNGDKVLNINSIYVDKDKRGQGIGTKFLEDLIRFADKYNYILTLTPSSDFGSDVNKLKKFYFKFKFQSNKGSKAINQLRNSMFRLPKNYKKDR